MGVGGEVGDKGSRLVDTKKRDQEAKEDKKLATRELLLGAGLSEERQARELVSGTPLAELRQESWPSREILHAASPKRELAQDPDPSASLAIPKQAKSTLSYATELNLQ
jgi:hypothetical protein